ncbi:MAG: flagellar motor protein MotB [Bacteroidales bacterium]|nr:flagellar motor protein MotB [Candidatus Latescibacterota bacterium]
MARKGRKKCKAGEQGAPAWMVTYGDLMSLLLCFFVMLVSMSSITESKFREAMGSLLGALGVMSFDSTPLRMENLTKTERYDEEIERIREEFNEFKMYLKDEGLDEVIEVFETDEGMLIRMEDPVLFPVGRAEMNDTGREILKKLTFMLIDFESDIRIEGHTDDIPINTSKFPSNWELSAGRAISVLRLMNSSGVPGIKLTAIGRGEYHPIIENTSDENRSQNRRVEIFVDYKEMMKIRDLRGLPIQEENNG